MQMHTTELLDAIEQQRQNEIRGAGGGGVGPSDYGKCRRQIAYQVRGTDPEPPTEATRAALMGTFIHDGIARGVAALDRAALADGDGFPLYDVEHPVAVPGLDREGHADLLWWDAGVLVDHKSTSPRGFDYVLTHGAKHEHVGQMEAYALGINREQPGAVTTLRLAYINRDNGDVWETEWAYDEASARARVDWLVTVESMIEDGHEMPRDGSGPGTGFPCDWCPFVRTCWDLDNVPEGRSAASQYTETDEQIEAGIADYLEAQQAKAKAERALKDARARLVGIRYKANGYALSWSRPREQDTVDVEALTALAVEKGLDVPMTTKTVAGRISVKRTK